MQNHFPPYGGGGGGGGVQLPSAQASPGLGPQEGASLPGPVYCPPGAPLGYAGGMDLISHMPPRVPVLPPPAQPVNYLHASPLLYGNYDQLLHHHQQISPPGGLATSAASQPSNLPMFPSEPPPHPHFTASSEYGFSSDPRLALTVGTLPTFPSLQNNPVSHALSLSSPQNQPYGFTPPMSNQPNEGNEQLFRKMSSDLNNFVKPSVAITTVTSNFETYSTGGDSVPIVTTGRSRTSPTSNSSVTSSSETHVRRNIEQMHQSTVFPTTSCESPAQKGEARMLSPISVNFTSPYSTSTSSPSSSVGINLLPPQPLPSYDPLPSYNALPSYDPVPSPHQRLLSPGNYGLGGGGSGAVTAEHEEHGSVFEKALLNFQHMELSAVTPQALARYGITEETQLVGDKFFCKKCNYYTTRVNKVLQHLKAHRGNITCDICGKAFLKRADKVRHMGCHTSSSLKGPRVMKLSPYTDVPASHNTELPPSESLVSTRRHESDGGDSMAMDAYTYPFSSHSEERDIRNGTSQPDMNAMDQQNKDDQARELAEGDNEDRTLRSSETSDGHNSEHRNSNNSTAVFNFTKQGLSPESSRDQEANISVKEEHRGRHTSVKLRVGDSSADEDGECNEIILMDESLEENIIGEIAPMVKEEAYSESEDRESNISEEANQAAEHSQILNTVDVKERVRQSIERRTSLVDGNEMPNDGDGRGSNGEIIEGDNEGNDGISDHTPSNDVPVLPNAIESISPVNKADSVSPPPQLKLYKTPIFQYGKYGSRRKVKDSPKRTHSMEVSEPTAFNMRGQGVPQYNMNSLRCIYCSYTGSSPKHLAKHYKAHATSYKVCRFCNKAFERPSDLVRHEQRHIRNQTIFGSEDIRSNRTGQDSSEVKSLFMKPPLTNKRNVLHCRRCGFATTDQHMLNRHLAKSHKQQIFSCEFCTHKFLSETALYNHIIECHSEPSSDINVASKLKKTLKYWTCSICEKTCITRKELATHFSMQHNDMQDSELAVDSGRGKHKKKVIDFTAEREAWQTMQQRAMEYSPYVYQPPNPYNAMQENYPWAGVGQNMQPSTMPPILQSDETRPGYSLEREEYHVTGDYVSAFNIAEEEGNSVDGSEGNEVEETNNSPFPDAVNSDKSKHKNLMGKIRKQVEKQMQHKSREAGSGEYIKCPICAKDFDSVPVCTIHQLVSHSMCSIRVDTYKNNIITGTDLMKAEVVAENEVSLFLDPKDKFADASGYKEVPSVSSVQDAKSICTKIIETKTESSILKNELVKSFSVSQNESEKPNDKDEGSGSSSERIDDSAGQKKEHNKKSSTTYDTSQHSHDSSSEIHSYVFNITPENNDTDTETVRSGSTTLSMEETDQKVLSTIVQQVSPTRPEVIKPQTISAIAAEVQQLNAQRLVSEGDSNEILMRPVVKQTEQVESHESYIKNIAASSASCQSASSTATSNRKSMGSSEDKKEEMDPDAIVRKILSKYAHQTDDQHGQNRPVGRPALNVVKSNGKSTKQHLLKWVKSKNKVAPHIQDHSYVSAVSGSAIKSPTGHSISVLKRKNTDLEKSHTTTFQIYNMKKRKPLNQSEVYDSPMMMPTITSVVSLSPEAAGLPRTIATRNETANASNDNLPVLNSITDINMIHQSAEFGFNPVSNQGLQIVGCPIPNANMMRTDSCDVQSRTNPYDIQPDVDWTAERLSQKNRVKCKPGPSKFAAYRCHRCSYGTNALHKYKQHEAAHAHAKYVCKVCDKACIKSCDLVRHWVAHNIKTPDGGFRCDSCEFSDADKEILERHMLCHYYINKRPPWELNNSDPAMYEPKLDGKRWLSQHGRIKEKDGKEEKRTKERRRAPHMSSSLVRFGSGDLETGKVPDEVKEIPKQLSPVKEMCRVCNKLVPRLLMSYHMREDHGKAKSTSHIRTRHQSKYYCPKCGLGFSDPDAMFKHSFLEHDASDFEQSNENPDKSKQLEDSTSSALPEVLFPNLEGTTLTTKDKVGNYHCEECTEVFTGYYQLEKHRRNVHLKIAERKVCPICSKGFRSPSYLSDHMRLHTGEKPHQCPKCPASFAMLQYLQLHMRKKHKRKKTSSRSGLSPAAVGKPVAASSGGSNDQKTPTAEPTSSSEAVMDLSLEDGNDVDTAKVHEDSEQSTPAGPGVDNTDTGEITL